MPLAYIGLGANLAGPAGPPEATLAAAAERLRALGRLVGCSSLYLTPPEGYTNQPRFLNAVIGLETGLSPRELLDRLLEIELEFGRVRSTQLPNRPRTLDLDLLLYGDLVLGEDGLAIPHPRFSERVFVLVPLQEIAPEAHDPRTGTTVSQYLRRLLSESPGAVDEVVKIESDRWRAGTSGPGVHPDACRSSGPDSDSPHG
jgi:2-amino-4-hydroxy-6-hydroxymethyldihydropteridine diphosphokinase